MERTIGGLCSDYDLTWLIEQTRLKISGVEIGEKKAREAMYSLKAQGFVRAMPIFTDSLMLNGKGWFKLNPPSPNKE